MQFLYTKVHLNVKVRTEGWTGGSEWHTERLPSVARRRGGAVPSFAAYLQICPSNEFGVSGEVAKGMCKFLFTY